MSLFEQFIQRISRSRKDVWIAAGGLLTLALLYKILDISYFAAWSMGAQIAVFTIFALLFSTLIYGIIEHSRQLHLKLAQAKSHNRSDKSELDKIQQRLDAVFSISQGFVEASEEGEVVDLLLPLSVDLTSAAGASFVPLDEHFQPKASINYGQPSVSEFNTWVEYLASPAVRSKCEGCAGEGSHGASCPLITTPLTFAVNLKCFPLRRGDHEYGVLNLLLPENSHWDQDTQRFMHALAGQTALALEGVRLRRREIAALRQLQGLREKSDLDTSLESLLENLHQTLETDFALLNLSALEGEEARQDYTYGQIPNQAGSFIRGVIQGVIQSREPLLLGDVSGDPASTQGVYSLVAVPLVSPGVPSLGALVVGNSRVRRFRPRHLALAQTIAGQAALLVHNANLLTELEYKTMLQERTRLAREIHDGLAQTLGFLKLQMAQLQKALDQGHIDRLEEGLTLCYKAVSEAYLDAREAIDGLHIDPLETGFGVWLQDAVADFAEVSGVEIEITDVPERLDVPPEILVQIIRIIQEAFSNIRKHAQAKNAWIACWDRGANLVLEIRDDGAGFTPEQTAGLTRHGLRGMRERAELIGADFQIVSRPQEGTTVRVQIPVGSMEVN
jgi:two-component system nitrate/nitrite sensor histidine kinase NarX